MMHWRDPYLELLPGTAQREAFRPGQAADRDPRIGAWHIEFGTPVLEAVKRPSKDS